MVVVRREGRFLVIQRAANILAGGCWCFVGGGVEPGEEQAEAVEREFAEEVGGKVRAIRKIWCSERGGKLRLHWWLAELLDDNLTANPHEVAEMRWLTAEEILALPQLLETNDQFLRTVSIDD